MARKGSLSSLTIFSYELRGMEMTLGVNVSLSFAFFCTLGGSRQRRARRQGIHGSTYTSRTPLSSLVPSRMAAGGEKAPWWIVSREVEGCLAEMRKSDSPGAAGSRQSRRPRGHAPRTNCRRGPRGRLAGPESDVLWDEPSS